MTKLLVWIWCAGALLAACVDGSAQTRINTDTVQIALRGIGCEDVVGTIHLVLNGDDQHPFAISRSCGCEWSGRTEVPFELYPARISLRLRGARTACLHPDDAKQQSVAKLFFDYVPGTAHDLNVDAQGPVDKQGNQRWVDVDYVRSVRSDFVCRETGMLTTDSRHSIADVNDKLEDLRFRFRTMSADDPGLLVNDEAVLKKAKKPHVELDAVHILNALKSQTERGKRLSSPHDYSTAEREADKKMLQDSGLQRLAIQVP
jgi:hypothetical protein